MGPNLHFVLLCITIKLSERKRNRKTRKRALSVSEATHRRLPTFPAQPSDYVPPTPSSANVLLFAVATHRKLRRRRRRPLSLSHLDVTKLHLQRILENSKQTVMVLPASAIPTPPALSGRRRRQKTMSFGMAGIVSQSLMAMGNSNSKWSKSVRESGRESGSGWKQTQESFLNALKNLGVFWNLIHM